MKYILITLISLIIYPLLVDIVNLSFHNNKIFHSKSNSPKLKYEKNGIKILSNNNFDIFVFDPKKVSFGVTTSRPSNKTFYMNSNFFNKSAIGLVVENNVRKSNKVPGGGYFYTSNGVTNVQRGVCPKKTQYASQTILWGIDNSKINKSLINQRHAKIVTYRNIVGKNKKGEIIFIISNFGGVVTIEDVIKEGLNQGMIEGILFDGGSSVEYKFDDGNYSRYFSSMSDLCKSIIKIDKPKTYIYMN